MLLKPSVFVEYMENIRTVTCVLTLNPLTSRIWWTPNNASKWQMGFNSAFKGLIVGERNPLNWNLNPQGVRERTGFISFKTKTIGDYWKYGNEHAGLPKWRGISYLAERLSLVASQYGPCSMDCNTVWYWSKHNKRIYLICMVQNHA